jgi:hypothetical protein
VVFDLEFGQPVASTDLPSSKEPFSNILGCFGHYDVGRGTGEGGIDLLYCYHRVREAPLGWSEGQISLYVEQQHRGQGSSSRIWKLNKLEQSIGSPSFMLGRQAPSRSSG